MYEISEQYSCWTIDFTIAINTSYIFKNEKIRKNTLKRLEMIHHDKLL